MSWHEFEFFAPCAEGPVGIAHGRGAVEGPRPPLEAFRQAVSVGVRFLEVDLRVSVRYELLVWHGEGAERVRPGTLFDPAGLDSARVLLFEELLEELPRETRFFVDLKYNQAGELLARVARATGASRRICVGSFVHGRTMAAAAAIVRLTGDAPCTAMTPRQALRLLLRSRLPRRPWRSESVSAQIPLWMATEAVIAAAHAGGALVFPWTANDSQTMETLLDRGADGVMTDDPALLARVLRGRHAG